MNVPTEQDPSDRLINPTGTRSQNDYDQLVVKINESGNYMLDFSPFNDGQMSIADLARTLTPSDLRTLTNEMIDTMLALIEDCEDADVLFVPYDPHAYDEFAADEEVVDLAWTLGHVIVHTTASSEEAAFLAAELARGVPVRLRRSRYEVPWETVTTIAACRQRLEESRRMRLASLEMWPEKPDLENFYFYRQKRQKINARMRFLFGLKHDNSHLEQIAEIVRQAKEARGVNDQLPTVNNQLSMTAES
jgi:hypothetical protein